MSWGNRNRAGHRPAATQGGPIWIWAVIAFFAGFWILQADTVRAQDSDSSLVTNQLWTDYYAYWHVKPSVQFYGDAGFRYLIDDGSWWDANIRPSVRLMQGNWVEPRGGLGFFFTDNEDSSNLLEMRPWQGLLARWPTFGDRSRYTIGIADKMRKLLAASDPAVYPGDIKGWGSTPIPRTVELRTVRPDQAADRRMNRS